MSKLNIERDEKMQREYIPLAAGYEWQTKGSGSTVRLLCPSGNQEPISWNPDWIREALDDCMRAQNAALAQHKLVIAELVELLEQIDRKVVFECHGFDRNFNDKIEAAIARSKALEMV